MGANHRKIKKWIARIVLCLTIYGLITAEYLTMYSLLVALTAAILTIGGLVILMHIIFWLMETAMGE